MDQPNAPRSDELGSGLVGRAVHLGLACLIALQWGACARSFPPASTDEDAALAFAALERRLVDAPNVSFSVSLNEITADDDWTTRLNGKLWMASGNRIRIESAGEVNELDAAPGLISDGSELTGGRSGIDSPYPDFSNSDVPPDLGTNIKGSILRWGVYRTLMQLVSGSPPGGFIEDVTDVEPGDPEAHVAIRNASWGLPETYDGTAVRPLRFSLPHPIASEVEVVIWLSLETSLPVRQTVRINSHSSERITDEVYSDWSFEDIPDSTFSLP